MNQESAHLHNSIDQTLVVTGCITNEEQFKVECIGCKGIPLESFQCVQCKRLLCKDYCNQSISKFEPCPSCQTQFGGEPSDKKPQNLSIAHQVSKVQETKYTNALDPSVAEILQKVKVICPNYKFGCDQALSLDEFQHHISVCIEECKHCGNQYPAVIRQKHQSSCEATIQFEAQKDELYKNMEKAAKEHEQRSQKQELGLSQINQDLKKEKLSLEFLQWKQSLASCLTMVLVVALAGLLLLIVPIAQEPQGDTIKLSNVQEIIKELENRQYFTNQDKLIGKFKVEERFKDILDALHHGLIKRKHSIFDLDKYHQQLTTEQFYKISLYQLQYLNKIGIEKVKSEEFHAHDLKGVPLLKYWKDLAKGTPDENIHKVAHILLEGRRITHVEKGLLGDVIGKTKGLIEDSYEGRDIKHNILGSIKRFSDEIGLE